MATKLRNINPAKPSEADIAAEELQRKFSYVGDKMMAIQPFLYPVFNALTSMTYSMMEAQGFWESDNTGEKVALMHSELSELLEADRKGIEASDHISDFTGVEEELADLLIRAFDFAGHHQLRLADAIIAKIFFNLTRPPKHGKAY